MAAKADVRHWFNQIRLAILETKYFKYVLQDGSKSIKIYYTILYQPFGQPLAEMNIQTLHGQHGCPHLGTATSHLSRRWMLVYRLYRPRQPINQV